MAGRDEAAAIVQEWVEGAIAGVTGRDIEGDYLAVLGVGDRVPQ